MRRPVARFLIARNPETATLVHTLRQSQATDILEQGQVGEDIGDLKTPGQTETIDLEWREARNFSDYDRRLRQWLRVCRDRFPHRFTNPAISPHQTSFDDGLHAQPPAQLMASLSQEDLNDLPGLQLAPLNHLAGVASRCSTVPRPTFSSRDHAALGDQLDRDQYRITETEALCPDLFSNQGDDFLPPPGISYERHRPEQTLLYRIIKEHWPRFQKHLERQGKQLPAYVIQEFEDFLKCGCLQHGFLRVQCESCHAEKILGFSCKRRGICPSCGARRMADSAAHLVDGIFPERPIRQWVLSFPFQLRFLFATEPQVLTKVLSIVHRVIGTDYIKRAGLTVSSGAQTGAVTLLQRAGSALNLNPHLHILAVDGAFNKHGAFYPVKPPSTEHLDALTHTIALRVARYLERVGYLVRDAESDYLDLQTEDDDAMATLIGASISYRLAFGPNAGRKALTLQTIPATTTTPTAGELVSNQASFSLHAGTACKPTQKKKLERLCRYITRSAISEKRLSLASNGNVVYQLKTPYDDGTTHVVLSPMEFMGRLAALVPKPRMNLTRFHGVFSPNSKLRGKVVPAKAKDERSDKASGYGQTWAQRLKRVFAIDTEKCEKCGGTMKVIACIEDPEVIDKILKHLGLDECSTVGNRSPPNPTGADIFALS